MYFLHFPEVKMKQETFVLPGMNKALHNDIDSRHMLCIKDNYIL